MKWSQSHAAPISGLLIGIVTSCAVIFVGIVLCVIFLPLGLIVIVGALFMPIMGIGMRTGQCPNCRQPLRITKPAKCPRCAHRISVMQGRFVDFT